MCCEGIVKDAMRATKILKNKQTIKSAIAPKILKNLFKKRCKNLYAEY